MELNELRIKVQELADELGSSPDKISAVISGLNADDLKNALSGNDPKKLEKIEKFFSSREYAFSVYNEEQIKLIKRLEERIVAEGSVSKALQGATITESVASSLRKGTYKGLTEKKFRELSEFLDLKKERATVYQHDKYVPTSISESVYENIRTAHINGVCIMITGDAGIGKTEGAKHYVETHPDNSVIITAIEPKTNKTAMLEMLAAKLGIDLSETKRSMYSQKILSELHNGTVIIVDEAQNFNFAAIDTLRGFADYFRNEDLGTVGIVCMGNDTFRQQFFGKSGIGKEQVWNRFVERPKYETKSIRLSDIKQLFPHLSEQGLEKEIRFLYGIALSPKEDIRSAVHLFTTVYNRYNGDCSIGVLTKQAKRMQIDLTNIESIMKRIKEEAT